MNERSRFTPRQHQLVPLQPIPSNRKPYRVQGMADTVVYLTEARAAHRLDLIPQFEALPEADASESPDWITSKRE